jgi:hypothetical protein
MRLFAALKIRYGRLDAAFISDDVELGSLRKAGGLLRRDDVRDPADPAAGLVANEIGAVSPLNVRLVSRALSGTPWRLLA